MVNLVGVIYDDQGICEQNYLYTLDELAEKEPVLLASCLSCPEKWIEGSFRADKTYMAKFIRTSTELEEFLSGKYNSLECADPQNECYIKDWYWTNVDSRLF